VQEQVDAEHHFAKEMLVFAVAELEEIVVLYNETAPFAQMHKAVAVVLANAI
jgi:hypothetical protein